MTTKCNPGSWKRKRILVEKLGNPNKLCSLVNSIIPMLIFSFKNIYYDCVNVNITGSYMKGYSNSLCYTCNTSVNLKLFQNKKFKKEREKQRNVS